MDRDMVESLWKNGSRSQIRRLGKGRERFVWNGQLHRQRKDRIPYEKRWNSSKGLKNQRRKLSTISSQRKESETTKEYSPM